ncbi:AAA family ATPase [Mesorhizobium sp. WSM4313]|uniref:ATP-dependent nuclease n=1 Tax=Mesorhizobium sp. WSM4313 TaxID=2029412 RepID=UPI000BAF70DA|nr:AAA family ATPase [Mesorhizobium sp. WSM4313]PBB17010.1 AAA family ATPase [Mesorhizobium sp. WSM4313]
MALSREVRRLERSWQNESAWPKRLDWVEIENIRGWQGQRIRFPFPIVAIAGENGSGKSTIIQACAAVYQGHLSKGSVKQKGTKYASDFFPSTFWDQITNAAVKFGYTEGKEIKEGSIRKHTERWKGNVERPVRPVQWLDLSRIVPIGGRVGYAKIARSIHIEATAVTFDEDRLGRLSSILGHKYDNAKMALTDVDPERPISVLHRANAAYSGYHQGQGEITIAELIQADLPKYSLVLIDEIESSLHPRAQRRLIRDLATVCRERELQIILTTHSPYVLEELPREARLQIFEQDGVRQAMIGVSPEFALSRMDDVTHPECELYVEDDVAQTLVREILSQRAPDIGSRVFVTPYGAASVGYQLGQMVDGKRFPRPVGVFLDGDCKPGVGCCVLPGEDAPERVIFEDLAKINWGDLWVLLLRDTSIVSDACNSSLALSEHHDWIPEAAKRLMIGGNILWHAMCAAWVKRCMVQADFERIRQYIEDRFADYD